jgi:DHA1 family bicyclomycin/chloramphenicol resistance-like MFS transporter
VWFPVLFGALASTVGLASLVNAKWVMRWGSHRLVGGALLALCGLAVGFGLLRWSWPEIDRLEVTYVWMGLSFFTFGLLFGNLMALSLQPLGHMAGVASALMSTLTNLIATALGAIIGHFVIHDISGMVWGTALCSLAAYAITYRIRRRTTHTKAASA